MAAGNLHNKLKAQRRKAAHILNRLYYEAVAVSLDAEGNEKPINATQLRAGELFLRKTMPDLKSTELKAKVDGKIEVTVSIED